MPSKPELWNDRNETGGRHAPEHSLGASLSNAGNVAYLPSMESPADQPGEEASVRTREAARGEDVPSMSTGPDRDVEMAQLDGQRRRRAGRSIDELRAGDVMTIALEVCDPETALDYVARMMADRNIGAVPVVENTDSMRLVGIVTDRDLVVRVLAKGQDPYRLTADDCMSSQLLTVTADTPLRECLDRMARHRVRRLVVVDKQDRCIGLIAQADIARAVPAMEAGTLLRQISVVTA